MKLLALSAIAGGTIGGFALTTAFASTTTPTPTQPSAVVSTVPSNTNLASSVESTTGVNSGSNVQSGNQTTPDVAGAAKEADHGGSADAAAATDSGPNVQSGIQSSSQTGPDTGISK